MKNKRVLKALVLSVAMAWGMLGNAQSNDAFFNVEEGYRATNFAVEWGFYNTPIGAEAPVGSGLLILAIAGAGYVALKKKEERL